jgi:hypothetical protein
MTVGALPMAFGAKDVAVGAITLVLPPVAEAQETSNGPVVGMDASSQFALWHLGTRYDRTVPYPTRTVADLEAFGTTAPVSGSCRHGLLQDSDRLAPAEILTGSPAGHLPRRGTTHRPLRLHPSKSVVNLSFGSVEFTTRSMIDLMFSVTRP